MCGQFLLSKLTRGQISIDAADVRSSSANAADARFVYASAADARSISAVAVDAVNFGGDSWTRGQFLLL